MSKVWIRLDVAEITRATEKAFLVVLKGGEEVWLPFSQVRDAEEYEVGMTDVEMPITEWLAEQKGLL